MHEEPGEAGLADSMRSALGSLVSFLHLRIELFGVEFQQELWRARNLFIWAFATLLLGLLAVGFAGAAIIVAFWDSPRRELVSVLVAGGFVVLMLLAVIRLQRTLSARPRLFEGTLAELKRDAESLGRR